MNSILQKKINKKYLLVVIIIIIISTFGYFQIKNNIKDRQILSGVQNALNWTNNYYTQHGVYPSQAEFFKEFRSRFVDEVQLPYEIQRYYLQEQYLLIQRYLLLLPVKHRRRPCPTDNLLLLPTAPYP